jgi:hypothetical protein
MKTRNVLNSSLGKFFQFLSMSLLVVVVLAGINLHQTYARSLAESPNAPTEFCDSVTEITKSECEALVALYDSTNGDNWTDNTNWLVTYTPSDWVGVEVSGGHVSHIFLQVNHLTGAIPPELGNLTALQSLYLQSNQLTGSIPPELGNLTELQVLVLASNQLSGSIPPELGNLTALTALSLCDNQLTGSIPPELGNLTALQYLALYSNQLTGSLPAELGNLTALLWLTLDGNQLTGSIPPELGNLTALQWLALDGNQLTGSIPPELGNLTALLWLTLEGNQLTGSIPLSFVNLYILEVFYFFDTDLCEPTTPEYLAWKSTVMDYQGTGVSCEIEDTGYSIFLPSMQK